MYTRFLILQILISLLNGNTESDISKQVAGYLINFGGLKKAEEDLRNFIEDSQGVPENQSVDNYVQLVLRMVFEATKWGQGLEYLISPPFLVQLTSTLRLSTVQTANDEKKNNLEQYVEVYINSLKII